MATARSGTTGPPRPEPPTPAGLRRPRSLPEQPGGPRPHPRRLSPVTPRPLRDPTTPGTPPATGTPPGSRTPPGSGTPPALLAAAADLRVLTKRCAGGARGAGGPGPPRLPPLVAALTRRTGATERPQPLRSPTPPPRGLPPPPRPPGLCPSAAPVPPPPGRGFPDVVTLRPQPALCGDTGGHGGHRGHKGHGGHEAPEPLSLREIYRELCRVLPTERLSFDADPAVEPAAAAVDLVPLEPRASPRPHQDPPAGLFARYLRHVAATGSDFLCATFHLRHHHVPGDAEEPHEEPAPEPAPVAPPYQEGLWRPVELDPAELQPLQRRLNRLWAALGVPAGERAAMALKYGSGAALARLPAALAAWEAAAVAVARREQLLARLERLESGSAGPARFWRRGCREHRQCERALRRSEAPVRRALRRLRAAFGDTVTLRGRPYARKMRRDAVEMRYALQQRRRAAVMLGGPPREPPPGDGDAARE